MISTAPEMVIDTPAEGAVSRRALYLPHPFG